MQPSSEPNEAPAPGAPEHANQQMVDRLIVQGSLWSAPLIRAFRDTPRHRFLTRVYLPRSGGTEQPWRAVSLRGAAALRLVYSDRALVTRIGPAGPLSSSSQPSLMAAMLEDLEVAPGHRVLEVGTGTGYNAALLAHVAGPGRVVSVEVDRDVLAEAQRRLRHFPDRRVHLVHADGRQPLPGAESFDRILVTAAAVDLEPAWLAQTTKGGRIVTPLALAPGLAFIAAGEVRDGVFTGRLTRPAYFVPLRSEGETGEPPPATGASGPLRVQQAPWAAWFDRKGRAAWSRFVRGFVFFAWLSGLRVIYLTQGGSAVFGIANPDGAVCLLGLDRWHVADGGGDLAWELVRAYQDAGAPWPTEYEFQASPDGSFGDSCWLRDGPHCRQAWRLPARRHRSG